MVNISEGNLKAIFIVFVGAIIAATIIIPIANQTNLETNSFTVVNESVAVPGAGLAVDIKGRELITAGQIIDQGNDTAVNLSLRDSISSTTGLKTVQVLNTISTNATSIWVSYTYYPDGYVSGGSRSITLLIPLFAALAILIFVIVVFMKHGSLGKLIRSK